MKRRVLKGLEKKGDDGWWWWWVREKTMEAG
jgi:hypothetical protein